MSERQLVKIFWFTWVFTSLAALGISIFMIYAVIHFVSKYW